MHDICRNPRSACCSCCRFLLADLHGIREAALSVDSARVCVVDELVERLGDQDRVLAVVVSRRQAIREGWLHRVAVTVCRDERGRILVHRRSEQLSRFPTSTNRPGLAWAFSSQTRSPARWRSGDSCGEGSSTRRELADAEDVDRRLQERLRHRPKPTQESLHPGAFGCFLPMRNLRTDGSDTRHVRLLAGDRLRGAKRCTAARCRLPCPTEVILTRLVPSARAPDRKGGPPDARRPRTPRQPPSPPHAQATQMPAAA